MIPYFRSKDPHVSFRGAVYTCDVSQRADFYNAVVARNPTIRINCITGPISFSVQFVNWPDQLRIYE